MRDVGILIFHAAASDLQKLEMFSYFQLFGHRGADDVC
jgi:hypothetical protein